MEPKPAKDALMEVGRGFGPSDDVSLTELRSSGWLARLHTVHKMRVMSRNQTVGGAVGRSSWARTPAGVGCWVGAREVVGRCCSRQRYLRQTDRGFDQGI